MTERQIGRESDTPKTQQETDWEERERAESDRGRGVCLKKIKSQSRKKNKKSVEIVSRFIDLTEAKV